MLFSLYFDPQLTSVVSPERYWKELMDVHNPGVLEVWLGNDQQCYSTRVARPGNAGGKMFYWTVFALCIVAPPFLFSITWRKQLSVLQQVKDTKGGPAVMWACIAWMPLINLYMVVKTITTISHFGVSNRVQSESDAYASMIVSYLTIISLIAAVI